VLANARRMLWVVSAIAARIGYAVAQSAVCLPHMLSLLYVSSVACTIVRCTIVRCTAVPCNRCVLHLATLSLRVALGASAAGDAVGDVRVPGARRAVRCAVHLKPHL
jgi:hypothetical protein